MIETPEEQAEMQQALQAALDAALEAFSVANRTPAYHSYVARLRDAIRELRDMYRTA
jgi:hypothetical protein